MSERLVNGAVLLAMAAVVYLTIVYARVSPDRTGQLSDDLRPIAYDWNTTMDIAADLLPDFLVPR